MLEALFWLVLLVGAVTAPVGHPFRIVSAGYGDVARRHGLDPAAAQRVRRAVHLGQSLDGARERAAAVEWATTLLDRREGAPQEQRARWRWYVACEAITVAAALAGVVLALLRGGAPVLVVLFALVAAGPLVGPVVRRRRDARIRRAAELNQEDQPAAPPAGGTT